MIVSNTIWTQEDFRNNKMISAVKGSSSFQILELNEEEQLIKVVPTFSKNVEPKWVNANHYTIINF